MKRRLPKVEWPIFLSISLSTLAGLFLIGIVWNLTRQPLSLPETELTHLSTEDYIQIGGGRIWSVAFSPDGQVLAVGMGPQLRLYTADAQTLLSEIVTGGW
jgi:hypothetical protein